MKSLSEGATDGNVTPSMSRPTSKDMLKMARIDGTNRPGRSQGVVVDLTRPPQNRAQRRFLARLQRRKSKS